jgi:hypothetical protein
MRRARADLEAAIAADTAGKLLAAKELYAQAVKRLRTLAQDEVRARGRGPELARIERLEQQCAPEAPTCLLSSHTPMGRENPHTLHMMRAVCTLCVGMVP